MRWRTSYANAFRNALLGEPALVSRVAGPGRSGVLTLSCPNPTFQPRLFEFLRARGHTLAS